MRQDSTIFSGFGRSHRIGACRGRLRSLDVIGDARTMRHQLRAVCPAAPGVYGLIDAAGELMYVGKAKSLRHRLLHYFATGEIDEKARLLGHRAAQIVWERLSHEFSALVRELELIRRFRPRCNVQGQPGRLRRGYLCVGPAPAARIYLAPTIPHSAAQVYGPLSIGRRMRRAVEQLNMVFRLRDCAADVTMVFPEASGVVDRPLEPQCPRVEMGLCLGPCAGRTSQAEYDQAVRAAQAFLAGRDSAMLAHLEAVMTRAATERQFERAAWCRDTLAALQMLQQQAQRACAVQDWTWIYAPPVPRGRRTWHLLRRGVPVGAVRQPQNVEQARRALVQIQTLLEGESLSEVTSERESLPYALLAARWFHQAPQELTYTLSVHAGRAHCLRLLSGDSTTSEAS